MIHGLARIAAAALVCLGPTATLGYAMCAGPSAFLAPRSGSELPENPRLFLFVPEPGAAPLVRVATESGDMPFAMGRISTVPAFSAYRIDVFAEPGARFTVRVQDPHVEHRRVESEYTVVDGAPRVKPPASLAGVESEVYSWSCSYQKTQNLHVSDSRAVAAPAYRIDWADDELAFTSGRRQSAVIPADMMLFFGAERGESVEGTVLELGHVSCLGTTFEWKPSSPVYLAVAALHTDRTEQTVTAPDRSMELLPPRRRVTQILFEDYWVPVQYRFWSYLNRWQRAVP